MPTATPTRYRWELLAWLWLAFFLNQADRQLFNVLLPAIRRSVPLTDAEAGLIASLFVVTVGVCIPVAGVAGDLFSRKRIIALSVLVWSAATLLTGASATLAQLILFRSLAVGGGEAFYAPPANALIGEEHGATRSLAMAVHQTALYAGIILSGWLGGYVAERYDWRVAFYGFGGAGILLAGLLAWRLRSTPVASIQPDRSEQRAFLRAGFRSLFGSPTGRLLTVAFCAMVFVNVGFLTWIPTYLHETFRLSLTDAGFTSMAYHHLAAFGGVLLGGWLSDRLARRGRAGRLWVQAVGMLGAVPFLLGLGQATTLPGLILCLIGFGLGRGFYDANIYATVYDVVPPAYRSTASGLLAMTGFLSGAVAPLLLGYLKPTLGLSLGLSALGAVYLLGGLSVVAVALFHSKQKPQPAWTSA